MVFDAKSAGVQCLTDVTALTEKRSRNALSAPSCMIFAASADSSPGSTMKPLAPSWTSSFATPQARVTMAGVPAANASLTHKPH